MTRTAACLAIALLPLLFAPSHAQSPSLLQPEVLHSFTSSAGDFSNGVTQGSGGNFYGVSTTGGKFGRGSFFQITPSGTLTVLASFGDPDNPARGSLGSSFGSRLLASDGANFLYGTTDRGGRFDLGTVFRVSLAGTVETLVDFSGQAGTAPGQQPAAGVVRGPDGNFYGAAPFGGADDNGLLFRVSSEGRYQVLLEFTNRSGVARGRFPSSGLIAPADGSLIGTTSSGGKFDTGVIFRLTAAGVYEVLADFGEGAGGFSGRPAGDLALGLDGTVYGIYSKDDPDDGFIFAVWKVAPGAPAAVPFVNLVRDNNSLPIGFAFAALAVVTSGDLVAVSDGVSAFSGGPGLIRITPAGQIFALEDLTSIGLVNGNTFGNSAAAYSDGSGGVIALLGTKLARRIGSGPSTVLATVQADAGSGLGISPRDVLLVDGSSNVYGRTERGSDNDFGAIIKLPTSGSPTPLLPLLQEDVFSRSIFGNGYTPMNANPMVFHSSGDLLYASPGAGNNSRGGILRIPTTSGSVTTIANFGNSPGSFLDPTGGLIVGDAGNFYGRAYTDDDDFNAHDVVYRLKPDNSLELVGNLDQFGVQQFGVSAFSPLTFNGTDAVLGTLPFAGKDGQGLVYRMTITGQVSTLIELGKTAFDDRLPAGPLLREPTGSFILPTQSSFSSSHHSSDDHTEAGGGLLRIPATGPAQRLVEFTGAAGAKPGKTPSAPLVRDANGRIYGVTLEGGPENIGVLYRVDANGAYTPLHQFRFGTNAEDLGGPPSTGLTLAADGYIYGGTYAGSTAGGGTIFRFPLVPQGSATTTVPAPGNIEANSAIFKGSLTSNGYGGEYWFTYTEQPSGTPVESPRLPLAGFNGPQSLESFVTTLKGHRNYKVQLNATLGFGADAVTVPGEIRDFSTPNGAPRAADDTILVSANADNAPGEVLVNDIDLDDDTITIQSFTQGTFGSVAPDPNDPKKLIYTPTFDFFDTEASGGRDSFTYTITDNYAPTGPLTATATVNVLSDGSIAGDYAGLLVEEQPLVVFGQAEAAAPTANQIAAGFASIALGKARKFTARFEVGAKSVSVKGSMAEGRGTRVTNARSGLDGELRPTPGGIEGRITLNGRTLILRSGQAFAASTREQRLPSAFTMRFNPVLVEDPVGAAGLPAGSGFAVIRELKKSRAQLVGVLPDGTPFSKGTVIDGEKEMDFFTTLYKTKTGTFGGQITIDPAENIDGTAGIPTIWKKAPQARDARFAGGFETEMTVFGGKYDVPEKGEPPVEVGSDALIATFDRGGLFEPISTRLTFPNGKLVIDPDDDDAHAKPKFSARAGTVSGKFIPVKKAVKFRALVVQRDKSVTGFFLGTADAGSVVMRIEP